MYYKCLILSLGVFCTCCLDAMAQPTTFTIGKNTWMIPSLSSLQPAAADTVTVNTVSFIRRDKLDKYIPAGWSLPSAGDIRDLIASLDGEPNRTGGKTVDSAYLQSRFPFTLTGMYFVARGRLAGAGFMTAFYTGTDTLRAYDSTGILQKTQVALHVYSSSQGKINIEPTYARLPASLIYAQLLLVKRKEEHEK